MVPSFPTKEVDDDSRRQSMVVSAQFSTCAMLHLLILLTIVPLRDLISMGMMRLPPQTRRAGEWLGKTRRCAPTARWTAIWTGRGVRRRSRLGLSAQSPPRGKIGSLCKAATINGSIGQNAVMTPSCTPAARDTPALVRPASAEQQILQGRPPPAADGVLSLRAKAALEEQQEWLEDEEDERVYEEETE